LSLSGDAVLKDQPWQTFGVARGLVHNRRHQTRNQRTWAAGGGGDAPKGQRTLLHVAVKGEEA
jgi:hypothetical protein